MAAPSEPVMAPPAEIGLPGAMQDAAAQAMRGKWARWLRPSFLDVILIALPFWFFGLGDGGVGLLLADGDTGWHIRTGDWILRNRSFVHGDIFSFSKAGEPWFAWEWLSDVTFSVLHSAGGLQAIVLFGIVLAAVYCGLLVRYMRWLGANIFIALPLSLLGFGAATVHLLARPHLFTMVLVPAAAWVILADLRRPSRRTWLLIPLTIVWTNLHGGWLALIALLGLAGAGLALESVWGPPRWQLVRRYGLLLAGCGVASMLNPYGWRLHAHVFEYLSADWIKSLVSEFHAPDFRGENMAAYEFILLAACAAAGLELSRKHFVTPLWILFWAHSSLESGRHIPLFIAVAAPAVAAEMQSLWNRWTAGRPKGSVPAILESLAVESAPNLGRITIWPAMALALAVAGVIPLPVRAEFPSLRFPSKMVSRHESRIVSSRLYTEDQWADYLIYRLAPAARVFFDGRSDFYGKDLTLEYCRIMDAQHDWKRLLDKYRFDLVLVRPRWALAAVLKSSPEWRVVDDDGFAILFERSRRSYPAGLQAQFGSSPQKSLPRPNEMP